MSHYHKTETTPDLGEELFDLLCESVEDYAIFAMDPDGRILHWNAGTTRILGYEAKEMLGRNYQAIFSAEDIAAGLPDQELRIALKTGRSEDERWHVRKDGTRFWALGVVVPLRNGDNSLRGYGKILRDRTDVKELQDVLRNRAEALVYADEKKNVFLATLAHELRNPLQPLLTAATQLRRLSMGDAMVNGVAAMIERQVKYLSRMIDDLMDVMRANRGRLRLIKSQLEIGALIDQAVETTRPLLDARKHRLIVVKPRAPLMFDGDRDRLHQVFVNLLNNAARYTHPCGEISIVAIAEGEELIVRVRDTGIGLAAEHMETIFELFGQAHPAELESHAGLGLGLSIVKDIVSLHGGSVQARSEGIGKGSEFIVRLPLA